MRFLSRKQKLKEVSEIIERHHKGKLPKSYYSPDGHLYGKNIAYGERKTTLDSANRKKDEVARERAREKIERQIKDSSATRDKVLKERYENSRFSGGRQGRGR
jgi:hypothetical protein